MYFSQKIDIGERKLFPAVPRKLLQDKVIRPLTLIQNQYKVYQGFNGKIQNYVISRRKTKAHSSGNWSE